jgi:histidyl-tRNA synthetase
MRLQNVRGTRDLLPEEAKKFLFVEDLARNKAAQFGFEPIFLPIFEYTDVFKRTLGESSDVVTKEMYTFEDKGGDQLTLRPEATASVARAFISQGLAQQVPLKYFYAGPMFRHERPQKGRYRQFMQMGVELLGPQSSAADVEIILLGQFILSSLGVDDDCVCEINTLGEKDCRLRYKKALVDYFENYKNDLSKDSRERLNKNPLRILDSKDKNDRALIEGAPEFKDYLSDFSKRFYDKLKEGLQASGVSFRENKRLVRGLDYYCHTVFEFTTETLGAQGAVLSGGRYDGLVETMGGPSTPATGWGAGIDRLVSLMGAGQVMQKRAISLMPLEERAYPAALSILRDLTAQGYRVELTYSGKLQKRMKKANKANASHALILGEKELDKKRVQVKDLDSGEQEPVSFDQLAKYFSGKANVF